MFEGIAIDLVQIFLMDEFKHKLLIIRVITDFSSGATAVSSVLVLCVTEGARKRR